MGVTLRHFLVLGLLAFVVTYLCVPLARRLALRLDAVDYPSARRVNKKPTPRMGGVAMAAGIAAALIVEVAGEYFFGWAGFYIHGTDRAINHAGVMCGLLTIVCVGAMDDVYSLKPSVKFAGQILGATIIAASGLLLSSIANPLGAGFIQFGWWSYPLTVLYLVCFMNVINLIDGLDGLAAGIAAIASFFLFLIAFGRGLEETAMLSIILLGATLAFLRYNFAPASIFMGDSGSLLLGAMIGVISLMGVMRSPTVIVLAVPARDRRHPHRRHGGGHHSARVPPPAHPAGRSEALAPHAFAQGLRRAQERRHRVRLDGASGRGRLGYEQYPRCCGVGYDRHHAAGVVLDTVAPRHLRPGPAPPLPRPPHPPRRQAPLVRPARAVGNGRAVQIRAL